MHTAASYHISCGLLLCCSLLLFPLVTIGQEKDTAGVEIDRESDRTILLDQQFDRSISGGALTEMGTYNMPSEQQYYQRPFKGQEHLDMALKAYREQLKDQTGNNWFWNFLRAVSPYISMELGAFQTMEMEFVDRDNPLWESYKKDERQ